VTALFAAAFAGAQPTEGHYTGMAEASAAAMLDREHFVVAEDECNTLLIYKLGEPSPVGRPINLGDFLQTDGKASDIEGGARVGDVIYWISSHSLPKSGKPREWRHRFFGTKVDPASSPPTLKPVGTPQRRLIEAMLAEPKLAALNIGGAAKIPPEEQDGLNIEGLAGWKKAGLLIGFRNPLRAGSKAPLVPLENPAAVIRGKPPKFGTPILLDLDGRGVRSIDRVGDHYMIVAGPVGDVGTFALYRWSGKRKDKPVSLPTTLPGAHAFEALMALPGTKDILLLSDDGVDDGIECGSPAKASQKFRALRLETPRSP
jgi:hypothetical protein